MTTQNPHIFVTRHIGDPALQKLQAHFDVQVNPNNRVLTKQEIIEGAKSAEGLLCLLTDPIDADVIKACPNLKVVSNYAVGYNNIDLDTLNEKGIALYYTPGVLTETTADLTFALILAVTRRIVEADQFTRQGKFTGWAPDMLLGSDVHGKTLGILGLGRIGLAVAKRGLGFGMRVLYTARQDKDLPDFHFSTLERLLKESDIISIHVPYSPESQHMIDEKAFGMMKKTAFLINTARGPIVDEHALVSALLSGRIAGAGLDVYEHEPTVSKELLGLHQVVLLPHIGSATLETRTAMGVMAAENLIRFFSGKKHENLVNPQIFR